MKELSLHILDVAQNAVSAGAGTLRLTVSEREGRITITLADDGRGMDADFLARVTDPFTTTRTTRKVGLGLPLFRMAAEQTGGSLSIESAVGEGTTVTAVFHAGHIDCPPMGDLAGTVSLLIQGAGEMETVYTHETEQGSFTLDTRELREILGPGVSLAAPEVAVWLRDYLKEQEAAL